MRRESAPITQPQDRPGETRERVASGFLSRPRPVFGARFLLVIILRNPPEAPSLGPVPARGEGIRRDNHTSESGQAR
jgi:hypothetical protein